jgi:hypothetical protein
MVADPNLFADNSDGGSLTGHYFSLAKLVDDLLWCITFLGHLFHLCDIIPGLVSGGQVILGLSLHTHHLNIEDIEKL